MASVVPMSAQLGFQSPWKGPLSLGAWKEQGRAQGLRDTLGPLASVLNLGEPPLHLLFSCLPACCWASIATSLWA